MNNLSNGFHQDTIFALSSGGLPSGVAVVRVSGPAVCEVVRVIVGTMPPARVVSLKKIRSRNGELVIDEGLVFWFEGPASFTGEDCAEFQLHGGRAIVASFLENLGAFDGCRMAEPGEFSKRAFENGKFDLTEIEGLSDLIAADSEEQRKQAIIQSSGKFRDRLEAWRDEIVRYRALIEAELDFSDEDDVPGSVSSVVWSGVEKLTKNIAICLDDAHRGEIIREGFRVALMGPPNAGKSSLLNALAIRDVAIVSEEAGTTRDLLEVRLDISGYPVVVIDTAGIRDTDSSIEKEGIRRAFNAGRAADLVLWLIPADEEVRELPADIENAIIVRTKADLVRDISGGLSCSVHRADGLDGLIAFLSERVLGALSSSSSNIITRHRHRAELTKCVDHLKNGFLKSDTDIIFAAEDLRLAGDCIGRITGRIDVEDLLDLIFSEFCIGK